MDIKPQPKSLRPPTTDPHDQDRIRGRNGRPMSRDPGGSAAPPPPVEPEGQTQAQYSEVFVVTVCATPIGLHTRSFESLIPTQAAFGFPLYPLRLRGWWREMARGIDIFCTNDRQVGPGQALLTPRPTLRIKGLKAGATLGRIVAALTRDQIPGGHGDPCWLHLSVTGRGHLHPHRRWTSFARHDFSTPIGLQSHTGRGGGSGRPSQAQGSLWCFSPFSGPLYRRRSPSRHSH